MNLTPALGDAIASKYDCSPDWTGKTALDRALAEVIRRQGGLCAALTDDARRDLILTLGDNVRAGWRAIVKQQPKIEAIRAAEQAAEQAVRRLPLAAE